MKIKKVGVIGCGAMGSGIAQVVLQGGYEVVVKETDQVFLGKGLDKLKASLEKLVKKQVVTEGVKDAMMKRLTGTVSLEPLADCDLIVEAVFEDLQVKIDLLKALEAGAYFLCMWLMILIHRNNHPGSCRAP